MVEAKIYCGVRHMYTSRHLQVAPHLLFDCGHLGRVFFEAPEVLKILVVLLNFQ